MCDRCVGSLRVRWIWKKDRRRVFILVLDTPQVSQCLNVCLSATVLATRFLSTNPRMNSRLEKFRRINLKCLCYRLRGVVQGKHESKTTLTQT